MSRAGACRVCRVDGLVAEICGGGIGKELLLDTPSKLSKTLISRRKMGVVLETLLDTPDFRIDGGTEPIRAYQAIA